MKILILMTTALSVSLDSFFCGLSMLIKTKDNFKFVFGISLSVFILCILGRIIGIKTSSALFSYNEIIGGSILIIISAIGFFETFKNEDFSIREKNIFLESLTIGFAIGLDGSAGCVSLALSGYTSIFVPIFITLVHVLLMNLAIFISKLKISKLFIKFKCTPHIILFLLGASKIIFAF